MDADTTRWEFYQHFYPPLYRFVRNSTGECHSDVEDLVQDTLLNAWRDRARFRNDASPMQWLFGIAQNRIREKRRRQRYGRRAQDVLRALKRLGRGTRRREYPAPIGSGLRTRR